MGRKGEFGSFGPLLRRYRGRRGLTQEELAERAGLHAQEISQLERGVVRRPRSTTIEFLADALKLDARRREALLRAAHEWPGPETQLGPTLELEAVPDTVGSLGDAEALLVTLPTDVLPPRAPLPACSRMPLASNPLFLGRGDELLHVARALRGSNTTVALGQVVASTGLGGLGKTQLAVELVHRYGRYFAGGVFWLSFANADEVPLQVAACAGPGAMDLAPGLDDQSVEERVGRVQRAWQGAVPRLLVFDNCEEEALLEAWRPTSGGCRVLVTSRRAHWSPTLGITTLPLDLLPRPDSIELLRRYRPDLAPDDPELDAIAAELGDLPLALHLAGSYLRTYRADVSLDTYLSELGRSEVVQHASLLGAGLDDFVSPTQHVQGVAQTFAVCLGRLDRERKVDRVAVALLARMACMAPGEPVPRDLLARTLEDVDPMLRSDGLRRLGAVGLVEEGEGWLRMHRLLARFVRHEGLDELAQPAVDRALINCGEAAWRRHLSGPALSAVIPHLLDVASRNSDEEPRLAGLCNAAGVALYRAGDLRTAGSWLEQGITIRERVLGPDHPDTAQSLNNLGELRWAQGELAAARSLHERGLAIREHMLGPEHPDTATSLNNLAVMLQDQGEVAAARPLYERALQIRERVLGPDHPDTAHVLSNLAFLLSIQGELVAARPLNERALAIRERVLGPDHPATANSLNNLGSVLRAQGELAAARPLLERATSLCEQILGPEHPNTASTLNGLARLLRDEGELDVAESLLERVLDIRDRVLGPDHPDTAVSLHDLASLLRDQGDPAAARPLLERALAIRERVLGADHPDTVATRRALAELAEEDGGGSRAGGGG
jgi:tetratricopeptide (TPR) repeat protein/transcriptional regulator with XRE-family HTH domain